MKIKEIICEASYDGMIANLKRQFPDQVPMIQDQLKWAKQILKKDPRVVWWMQQVKLTLQGQPIDLNKIGTDIGHFFGTVNLNDTGINAIDQYDFKGKTPEQIVKDLTAIESDPQYQKEEKQEKIPVQPQSGDRVLIDCGNNHAWWYVDRAFCDAEGKSGEHCGNVTGQTKTDQRILSYRENRGGKWYVLLTFILEPNGKLGEMKAYKNQKPQEKYHGDIIKLLLNPIVKGISGGGYLADNNFSIFDLSENDLKTIQTNKPNLITDQLDVSPVQSINAPDFIRKQYYDTIVKNNRGLEHLLQPDGTLLKGDLAAWDAAIKTNRKLSLIVTGDMIDRYKKTILAELRINPEKLISVASRDIRRNFDILSEFVKFNSTNIGYVQASTPRYYDLCKIAVSEIDDYDSALIYIPKPPTIPEKEYIDICKIAFSKDIRVLKYVPTPPEITEKEYNEICKIAVSKDGNALRFVSPPLRTPDICKIAVSKDGNALFYVPQPPTMPENQYIEICKIAISENGNALHYVPEELRTTELCKIAVSKDGWALESVPKPPIIPEKKYLEISEIAVSNKSTALTYVPKELRTPKLYGIAILKDEDNWALDFVPEELRDLVQAEVEKEKAKKTESQELVRLKQLIEGLK